MSRSPYDLSNGRPSREEVKRSVEDVERKNREQFERNLLYRIDELEKALDEKIDKLQREVRARLDTLENQGRSYAPNWHGNK